MLLVFGAPCQLQSLAGQEHGRTIPLAVMSFSSLVRSGTLASGMQIGETGAVAVQRMCAIMWPRRLIDLFKIEVPIIQAPMAGAMDWELVAAVSSAGGLGSLPCAMLSPDQIREQVKKIRDQTPKPINLNFFCHRPAVPSDAREAAWRERLAPYYREMEIDPAAPIPTRDLRPFNAGPCAVVEDLKPEVVSFHFGLPEPALLDRSQGGWMSSGEFGNDHRRGEMA